MGFIPKFLWGRRNPNYTGPSRAAGIAATVAGDAMQIAQDFSHVVSAAEDAEYAGDEEAAEALMGQAAKIYATHRYFSNMVNSIPDREDELARWEDAYRDLRAKSRLDRRAEGPIIPAPQDYFMALVEEGDVNEVYAAMRVIPDSGTPETRRAYAEATGRPVPTEDTFSDGTPLPDEPVEAMPPPDDDGQEHVSAPPDPLPDDQEEIPLPEEPEDPEAELPPDDRDLEDSESSRAIRELTSGMGGSTGKPKKKRVSAGAGRPSKNPGILTSVEQATGLDKYGSTRVTWRPRLGPLILNMGRNGPSSLSLALGPARYRLWSRTHKQGFSSLDLPGGMSFRGRQISRNARGSGKQRP